jgi:hypothetical protein
MNCMLGQIRAGPQLFGLSRMFGMDLAVDSGRAKRRCANWPIPGQMALFRA